MSKYDEDEMLKGQKEDGKAEDLRREGEVEVRRDRGRRPCLLISLFPCGKAFVSLSEYLKTKMDVVEFSLK